MMRPGYQAQGRSGICCIAIASSESGQGPPINSVQLSVRYTPMIAAGNAAPPKSSGEAPTTALSMRNKLREQRAWNSLNQLISLCDEERRHLETKRLGGLEIDHQLELRRLLHGEVGGPGALQNLVHVRGAAPIEIEKVGP